MRSREHVWIKYKIPLWFYKEARQRYKDEQKRQKRRLIIFERNIR